MRLERIIAIHGGQAQTQSGLFPIIGNAHFAAGQIVPGFDGHVIGRVNPVSRRPAWKFMAPAVPAVPETRYYHFADASALKMYYIDTEFAAIVKTEDITVPVDGATLVLHCYNETAEYLVWFINVDGANSRCIIQKDGETIADFMSVFTDIPSSGMTDAYINSSGNLIWVAATDDSSAIIMAQYSNGTLSESKTYLYSDAESAIEVRIKDYIDDAIDKVIYSESDIQTYDITKYCAFPRTHFWGIQKKIIPQQLSASPAYTSSFSSSSAFTIYDLWGLGAITQMSVYGFGSCNVMVHETNYGWQTGEISLEADWHLVELAVDARIGWNYSFADGKLIEAIIPGQEAYSQTNTTSTKNAEYTTSLVSANEVITGVVTSAISTEKFVCTFSMPSGYDGFGTTAPSYCNLTFTSGKNAGLTRTAMLNHWSSDDLTHYELKFNPVWPNAPVAGDCFELEVSFGTYRTVDTICTASMSTDLPKIDGSGSSSVGTDFGNEYSLNYSIEFAEPDGQSMPVQTLVQNVAVIYTDNGDRPQSYYPFGPWLSDSESLTGLLLTYGNKLIQAAGTEVTATDFSLFSSTVTKRFVAK